MSWQCMIRYWCSSLKFPSVIALSSLEGSNLIGHLLVCCLKLCYRLMSLFLQCIFNFLWFFLILIVKLILFLHELILVPLELLQLIIPRSFKVLLFFSKTSAFLCHRGELSFQLFDFFVSSWFSQSYRDMEVFDLFILSLHSSEIAFENLNLKGAASEGLTN